MVVKTPRGSARCGEGAGNDISRPSTWARIASCAICSSILRSPGSYSVVAPVEAKDGTGVSDGRDIALLAAAQDERASLSLHRMAIDSTPEGGEVICRRN